MVPEMCRVLELQMAKAAAPVGAAAFQGGATGIYAGAYRRR